MERVNKKLASLRDLLENWYLIVWRIDATTERDDDKVIISSLFSSCMSKCVSEAEAIERRSTTSRLRLYISLSVNSIHEYVLSHNDDVILLHDSLITCID